MTGDQPAIFTSSQQASSRWMTERTSSKGSGDLVRPIDVALATGTTITYSLSSKYQEQKTAVGICNNVSNIMKLWGNTLIFNLSTQRQWCFINLHEWMTTDANLNIYKDKRRKRSYWRAHLTSAKASAGTHWINAARSTKECVTKWESTRKIY